MRRDNDRLTIETSPLCHPAVMSLRYAMRMETLLTSLLLAFLIIVTWRSTTRDHEPPIVIVQRKGTTHELRHDQVEALARVELRTVPEPSARPQQCRAYGMFGAALRLIATGLVTLAALVTLARSLNVAY